MVSLRRMLMSSRRFATVPPVFPKSPPLKITEMNKDSPKTENGIIRPGASASLTREEQRFVDGDSKKTKKSEEHEYEIVVTDNSNLWDQATGMIKSAGYVSFDQASVALLGEMNNVISLFLVRKSDNLLAGIHIIIEAETFIYGSIYMMREGHRDSGWGMKMTKICTEDILGETIKRKSLLFIAVDSMVEKYAGPPWFAVPLYEMFTFRVNSREELMRMFPAPTTHEYSIVPVRDLTPRQFQQLIDYDKMVTGLDRTTFLQNYYSLDFVEGVVLYNTKGKIKGMAGLVPTFEENLYKMNPIFAENKEDAAILVHAVTTRTDDPRAKFVCHVRADSAGDWIIKKCKDENVKLDRVGTLVYGMMKNQPYKDPSRTEFVFAPTNSPAYFDG